MNGHIQRGLPPTPTHGMHFDSSRPPPTPKEMYSQGMYASIEEQGHYEHKKQAPPPPRRNPETRLSTSSTGTYEEIHVQEYPGHHQHGYHQQPQGYGNQSPVHMVHGSPAHQHGYHHQQQGYGNQSPVHMVHGSPAHQTGYHQHQQVNGTQSPRHTAHGSPVLRSKAGHEPQSPGLKGNQPFSYGAPPLSPKLHRAMDQSVNQNIPNSTQNGHSQQNVPNLTNYQYTDQTGGSPVMNYGKHESAFHPQSHRPPPCGPPPPVPPDHTGPGHRVTAPQPQYPQSPKIQRHSSIQGSVHRSNVPSSPQLTKKLSQRSKSVPCNPQDEDLLPAPPPPLTIRENYMAAALQSNRTPSPPLPPPPPEMLMDLPPPPPQPEMLRNVPQSVEHIANQGLPHSAVSMSPRHQPAAPPPPPPPVSSIPKKRSDLPAETVGSYPSEPVRGHNLPATSPPRLPKEASPDQAVLIQQIGKVHLKKTGIKTASEEPTLETLPEPQQEAPPPPAPTVAPQPPPAEPKQQTQVTPAVTLFEKKVEMITKGDQHYRRQGDDSTMDISLDNIDLDDVPGYTPITKSTPIWKRDMIEKKNQEKLEEYIAKKQRQKEEADKWKNVPAWKRKLMMEKSKEKEQKSKEDIEKAAQEEANRKRREKQVEEDRKAKIREQQEMEKKMAEEMQEVPEWKREIMMKRGGAIRNWADEREEQNEQELEEQRQAEMNQTKEPEVKKPVPRKSIDETKLEDEWESLPLWKREIMMKRGGAPSNWGDEREELNEEEESVEQ